MNKSDSKSNSKDRMTKKELKKLNYIIENSWLRVFCLEQFYVV